MVEFRWQERWQGQEPAGVGEALAGSSYMDVSFSHP